jgi:Sulfatase
MFKKIALITLLYVGLITSIHFHGIGIKQEFTLSNSLTLVFSWFSLVSFFVLIDSLNKKYFTFTVGLLVGLLYYFCKRIGFYAGYHLFSNNIDYFKSGPGWKQIFDLAYDTFMASDYFFSILFAGLLFSTYFFKPEKYAAFFKKKIVLFGCLLIILLSAILLPYSHDPITAFVRSYYRNFMPSENLIHVKSKNISLLSTVSVESHFKLDKKTNIILIMVESFNARFVNEKTAQGEEYLPFFNSLTKKNFYAKNYFSNSVYTSKGQFSALCNQVPMLKKTEYKEATCLKTECTPELLSTAGYKNYFAQADPNFDTDNTKSFLLSHGFDYFVEVAKPCSQETEGCYGLGTKDSIFYKRVFAYMNKPEFASQASKTPFFMTLATVSSHMPFTYMQSYERKFFKDPKNRREHYLNFLNLIDDGLKAFFTEFDKSPYAENSIVIVTGDHGFPLGEHGNFHNASYAYQENFGVPLLIYQKIDKSINSIKERFSYAEDKPFSHLNLGATILDLAQASGPTKFVAPSMFNEPYEKNDLYFIQPYGGGMIAIISWPYKYIFSTYRYNEWVYNLETDPGELTPLKPNAELLENLRDKAAQIYKQQDLYSCEKKN